MASTNTLAGRLSPSRNWTYWWLALQIRQEASVTQSAYKNDGRETNCVARWVDVVYLRLE